ncbi:hypothetical protein BC936DRAFT_140013 [Jimgerdemannia flammicorona]|uniref:RRM domain-containing protein n=1 Tax=Jimgerdemannia flammicorona TaxID=994334 RepID=A0A433B5Y2_9FUNG|nr:hypothetical protein BC936DRAFT_140013 [Jimgerdemannia flammicorona]
MSDMSATPHPRHTRPTRNLLLCNLFPTRNRYNPSPASNTDQLAKEERGHTPPSRSRSQSPRRSSERERHHNRSRSRSREREREREDRGSQGVEDQNPGNNLFVNGLSIKTTNADLEEFFSKYGKVEKAEIMYDPHSRDSRGFAFIRMDTNEDAVRAIEGASGSELNGRAMSVEKNLQEDHAATLTVSTLAMTRRATTILATNATPALRATTPATIVFTTVPRTWTAATNLVTTAAALDTMAVGTAAMTGTIARGAPRRGTTRTRGRGRHTSKAEARWMENGTGSGVVFGVGREDG